MLIFETDKSMLNIEDVALGKFIKELIYKMYDESNFPVGSLKDIKPLNETEIKQIASRYKIGNIGDLYALCFSLIKECITMTNE